MEDDTPQNVMNLDLNLGPVETDPVGLNLENLLDNIDGPVGHSIGPRPMTIRRRWRSIWRPVSGEGSVAAGNGNTPPELTKTCDDNNGHEENETADEKEKERVVKSNEYGGGFFDCNICFDMASDPVVTYCGHLFCWPCLYRWLYVHSDVKECPICKGEMSMRTVTPIYGRGNPTRVVEDDSGLKIPNRPQAKRVESFRQTIQRNVFTMPMEEMIRRLGSRFDLTRDLFQGHSFLSENSSLLNRYLASRRLRTDQDQDQNQEQTPSMDDRDSVSSIAAVIQSESQTVDTAVEIDSRVSLSTSSSRRRSESSRVSDVDSGDSRASRRRRLL